MQSALQAAEHWRNILRPCQAAINQQPIAVIGPRCEKDGNEFPRSLEKLFGEPPQTGAATFERAVCTSFKVGESQIRAAVAAGATLAGLQKNLKCGTHCGSCVPELRRLVAI